ncbi:hypothetical protein [Bacillus sp. CECT 9360]|uniref:hypothetical protein n=1 Tax=Bacillus sp. CECT 9360 TaxID=2845821 RepID=UPI001E2E73CC|nr:hypothetical protein [Bacillus sp. CECT 9360]CAH0344541.1 hypothetical protein BCI9360_00799 [Bacillus sp. CECT 9360]
MAYIDRRLMKVFRSKMRDPRNARRVYGILRSYRRDDLKHPGRCYGMVDRLSRCLGVRITKDERDNAAHWLMGCNVDPNNKGHRHRMWRMVNGGLF